MVNLCKDLGHTNLGTTAVIQPNQLYNLIVKAIDAETLAPGYQCRPGAWVLGKNRQQLDEPEGADQLCVPTHLFKNCDIYTRSMWKWKREIKWISGIKKNKSCERFLAAAWDRSLVREISLTTKWLNLSQAPPAWATWHRFPPAWPCFRTEMLPRGEVWHMVFHLDISVSWSWWWLYWSIYLKHNKLYWLIIILASPSGVFPRFRLGTSYAACMAPKK